MKTTPLGQGWFATFTNENKRRKLTIQNPDIDLRIDLNDEQIKLLRKAFDELKAA